MNYRLKPNKLDIFIITIITIVSLLLSFVVYFLPQGKGNCVSIYIMSVKEYSLNLNENQTLILKPGEYDRNTNTFPCLQGEMIIEIKNSQIRVEKEESPLHVCSKQGWVSIPNIPITCAPNYVVIVIENIQGGSFDVIL